LGALFDDRLIYLAYVVSLFRPQTKGINFINHLNELEEEWALMTNMSTDDPKKPDYTRMIVSAVVSTFVMHLTGKAIDWVFDKLRKPKEDKPAGE
jgi:hypothetical protein